MDVECEYAGDRTEDDAVMIQGSLELLSGDRFLVFTPSVELYSRASQCIIDLDHCEAVGAVTEPGGHFLLVRLSVSDSSTPMSTVHFRFSDRRVLLQFTDKVLASQDSCIESDSGLKRSLPLTVIPDYKDLCVEPPVAGHPTAHLSILSSDKPAANYSTERELLLTLDMATDVKSLLPLEHRFSEWRLVYSPKVHGISLPSFYRHFEQQPYPNVIMVTDSRRCCLFGAYCSRAWDTRHTVRRQYFGTEESFVFSLRRSGKSDLVYFPSTCSNSLFQFCDDQRVVVGGGSSGSAIVIFDNWLRGMSNACETFGTTGPLACTSEFVVGDIEFWALVPDDDSGQGSPVG